MCIFRQSDKRDEGPVVVKQQEAALGAPILPADLLLPGLGDPRGEEMFLLRLDLLKIVNEVVRPSRHRVA